MQAVILAAGKGTRMHPLQQPKPLLKVAGKTILEWNLEQLDPVKEVIVILGHKKEEVRQFLEKRKARFPFTLSLVDQEAQLGTFDALRTAQPLLKGRFLVMNGDDLYSREDIMACLKQEQAILAAEVSSPEHFGILETDRSLLRGIREKPEAPQGRLANTGLFVLGKEVFETPPEKSKRGELELTDAVTSLAQKTDIQVVRAASWLPVSYPWHLLEANASLLSRQAPLIEGEVEKWAVLKGSVSVGKRTLIRSGAYIEGPVLIGENCLIGPNCFIRASTSLGDSCKVGNAVEIKNCVVGDNVSLGHLSYFGDSILGNAINIGGGTIAANLRHDGKPIQVVVNGKRVETGLGKFGCIIGDGVHTGIHTSLYPGRKLAANTLPGQVVREDIL